MTLSPVLRLVMCSFLLGCGGQAERTVGEGGEGVGAPSGEGAGEAEPPGDLELGPCVKGFDRYANLDKECNWFAENLCYDTKEAACACVCPRTGRSVCISGFYGGEGSATPVYCD